MPKSKDPRRRMVTIRGILELGQIYNRLAEDIHVTPDEVILLLAVQQGQLEERPMDVSNLATITGMKFPTCHRHLKHLEKRGFIETKKQGKRLVHRFCSQEETPCVTRAYRDIEATMRKVAKGLSDLDNEITKPVHSEQIVH